MPEGGGTKLGNFYFDVMFRDQTQGVLNSIKQALQSINKDITVSIGNGKIGGDVQKIQQAINQKLSKIKATIPVLLQNNSLAQIQKLAAALQNQTVQIGVLLKNPTKANLNAIKQSVKGLTVEINTVLKDVSDTKLKSIKNSIERRLRVDARVNATTATSSLQQALKSRKFKFDVVVDQMKVARAVQAALNKAGLNSAVGLTADQARAQRALNQQAEAQARINRQNAESQARADAIRQKANAQTELIEQRKRTAIEQTTAAHSRAIAAQNRVTAAIQRSTHANNQNAASYMLIRRSMLQSIPLAGSLANMARNYVGVFGAVSAVRSLYRIRAEFERQAVALKALMQSASQARQVMGELQQMALKSPFSVSDIISFSKQLSAFSIGNNELTETTKRLADLSAGLGVDMSRLILAYGQVKAATVLRGQELRQFTEAGVPMVRALADEFTKMEGKVVTAADVFQRISKKAVSFEMVKKVLDSMTGEGGRFYEHQAKMVETLYGKMERMGDAYKVMMNQLGESNDSLLKAPIDAITKAMMDWRSTIRTIITMLASAGIWKIMNFFRTPNFAGLEGLKQVQLQTKRMQSLDVLWERGGLDKVNSGLQRYIMLSDTMTKTDWKNVVMKQKLSKAQTMYLYATNRLTKSQVLWIANQRKWNLAHQQALLNMSKMQLLGLRAGMAITKLGMAMRALAVQALPVAAITLFVELISQVMQANQAIEDFNNQVRESAREVIEDLREYLDSHKEAFDLIINPEISQDPETLQKTWEDLKEKISQMPNQELIMGVVEANADNDLKKLNANAIDFLRTMKSVADEISYMHTQLEVTQDTIGWGLFGEGAKSDIKDYEEALKRARKSIEDINNYLKYNKVDFSVSLGNLNIDSQNSLEQALSSANVKPAWLVEEFSRAMHDVDDASKEMNAEIVKSLKTSLLPAFEELRKKGVDTPKEMAAAYVQLMPQIRDAIGASSKEMQEELDRIALNMLSKNGFNIDESVRLGTTAAQDLRVRVEREAEAMGVNISEIIESDNQKLMAALLRAAIANAGDVSKEIQGEFDKLRNYIQTHPATFKVLMRVETQEDGEARKYLRALSGAKNNFELAKQYGASTPEGGDTNDKAIQRAKNNIEESVKEQRTYYKQLENLRKVGKQNEEEYKKVKDAYESAKEKEKQARKAYNDLGGDEADLKVDKPKKTPKAGGGSGKANTALQRLRNDIKDLRELYDMYSKAVETFQKLSKQVGKQGALDKLFELEEFKTLKDRNGIAIIKKFSGVGGMVDLWKELATRISKLGDPNADGPVRDAYMAVMEKVYQAQGKVLDDELRKMGENLKERIEVSVKNWKLFDTMFEATGDEAISSIAAFGGKKMFQNIEDELVSLFNSNKVGISFSKALTMDNASLRDAFGEGSEYLELLKRIKEMRESGWGDVMTAAAKAIEEQMTLEEKVQKQRMLNEKQLAEYVRRNGGLEAVMSNPSLLKGYNALKAQGNKMIAELESEGVKLSEFWKGLFNKLSEKTMGGLRRTIDKYSKALKDSTRNADGTWNVPGIDKPVTEGTFRQMQERIESLKEKLRDLSLSDYLKDLFGDMWNNASSAGEKIEIVALAAGRVHEELKKATGPAKEFFSALGIDEVGDYIDLFDELVDSVSDIAMGAGRIASGDILGGSIQAVGGLFSSITSFFNFHDKRLNRLIEESKRQLKTLQDAYEAMERQLERSLGGMYSTRSYQEQFANLKRQREEIQKQYDAELDKKKKDKEALIDYQRQLAETDDQIQHFAEDMANALYGIDIKNWAKELTDAVVGAWRNGENAAEAYQNKVKDIVADVATSIITQKIMETALQPVLDALVAEMTAKNGLLDAGTISMFATKLGEAGNTAVSTITGILDGLRSQGLDLSDKSGGTIGEGIKNITEDQANLLASYINAMRADLSVVRMLWEEHSLGTSVVSQAQLTQLNAIAANTLRNAEAAERIETALNSVITIGANGSRVRV